MQADSAIRRNVVLVMPSSLPLPMHLNNETITSSHDELVLNAERHLTLLTCYFLQVKDL